MSLMAKYPAAAEVLSFLLRFSLGAQEPINACFSKVVDHLTANRLADEVPSLQSRCFLWLGIRAGMKMPAYPPRRCVSWSRRFVYERCVKDSYERSHLSLEERKNHTCSRALS